MTKRAKTNLWIRSAAACTLALCSCAGPQSTASIDPFASAATAMPVASAAPMQPMPMPISQAPAPAPFAEAASSGNEPGIQQVAYIDDPYGTPGVAGVGVEGSAPGVIVCPACPRLDLPACGIEGGIANCAIVKQDEYLCDGGDRAEPVHYDVPYRLGLNTEDTVAEYVDDLGEFHMKPSNRVCVYSPRFKAVRTVSAPIAGTSIDRATGVQDRTRGTGVGGQVAAIHGTKTDQIDAMRSRERASGVNADAGTVVAEQLTAAAWNTKVLNVFENLVFLRSGRFDKTDSAVLGTGLQAAHIWTRDAFPVLMASTSAGQEVRVTFDTHEIRGVELNEIKGNLRIIKLADKQVAQKGDVITFTLRYDNIGDRELHHIRVVDNLTPRLEYVEDSAQADRDGKLTVEDNSEGSVILEFAMDGALPGREGGVITFQARVR